MTDIILINPRDIFSRYPYLGIGYIASALEDTGFKVRIIDAAALGLNTREISTIVGDESPKIVGITTMSMSLRETYQLIKDIQRLNKHLEIVVGGTHISADPGIIETMGIRYGFAGECERVFPIFCSHLINGNDTKSHDLPGLIMTGANLVANKPEVIENLDSLKFPARHLLPVDRYYSPNAGGRVTSMLASRGCPYNCVFCSSLSKTKMRFRSPENVVEEVDEVDSKYKCKYIEFVDELFTASRPWVLKICELLRRRARRIKWGCGTRANLVDKELLQEMSAAGCIKITFGVETGSERLRMVINKRVRDEDYLEAFRNCRRVNIQPAGGFILGHPTETREDLERTICFAKQLNARVTPFAKTIILPASPLFDIALEEGQIQPDAWRQFMLGLAEQPHYVPPSLSPEEMTDFYHRALRSFYYRPQYVLARLKELRTFTDAKNLWRSLLAFIVMGRRYE